MEQTTVEQQQTVTGKTVLSFTKPTPMWATWVFRIVFLLTTAGAIWVAATGLIPQNSKVEIMLAMKVLDVIIWGIGKGIGVDKSEFEQIN